MSMVATDIKSMITIKIKPRNDGYTDQYNRIFMVKLLLVSSLVMSVSWFQDSIHCIVPASHDIDGGFVSATCWIQGVYVYRELKDKVDKVAYYGIPKNMDTDGMMKGTEDLCITEPKLNQKPSPLCQPMTKTFFLQFEAVQTTKPDFIKRVDIETITKRPAQTCVAFYQWMPFLIASLAILYYTPYVAFTSVNQDMISLRSVIKSEGVDANKIAKHYFNHRTNPPKTLAIRVLMNILVKVLYLVANLLTFLGLNNILNKDYIDYGKKWVQWASLDNQVAYDYMGMRDFPKPGNHLLPPFGYCEMYESSRDVKQTRTNKHKFVCELSQNILYQYVLIVLWFAIIFGIILSVVGLIKLLIHYAIGKFGVKAQGAAGKKLFKALTFREIEYLEFIRSKNLILYNEILERLRDNILGPHAPNIEDDFPNSDNKPLYPHLPRRSEYQ